MSRTKRSRTVRNQIEIKRPTNIKERPGKSGCTHAFKVYSPDGMDIPDGASDIPAGPWSLGICTKEGCDATRIFGNAPEFAIRRGYEGTGKFNPPKEITDEIDRKKRKRRRRRRKSSP